MIEFTKEQLVENEINRVRTQYRESPKLLHMMRVYLGKVAEVMEIINGIPEYFDIDTAVGDQLTMLGKRLGFPRCHCVCNIKPVFGFECEGVPTDFPVAGFCSEELTWDDCGPFGTSDLCIIDDEVYRKFLKVRRYQMLSLYDIESLTEAIQIFWGPTAIVIDHGEGRVVIAPGRDITQAEAALLQLYPRVLPIAPGIVVRFHFGNRMALFGFGEGWGGFCAPVQAGTSSDDLGQPITNEDGEFILTETGQAIYTGPLTKDAEWMCEIDPRPYSCAA